MAINILHIVNEDDVARSDLERERKVKEEKVKLVEECLLQAFPIRSIRDRLRDRFPGSKTSVYQLIGIVQSRWEREDEYLAALARPRQIRSLYRGLALMEQDGKSWTAWLQTHRLISELQGTKPISTDKPSEDDFHGWSQQELIEFIESEGRVIPLDAGRKRKGK